MFAAVDFLCLVTLFRSGVLAAILLRWLEQKESLGEKSGIRKRKSAKAANITSQEKVAA